MAKKKRYPRDFKLNAARLIVEGGYSYRKAADRLGVSVESLRSWVKAFRASGELPAEEPPTTTRLRELQHEVTELRIENEILKSSGVLRQGVPVRHAWIGEHRDSWAVSRLCRALRVSRSGFYSWATAASEAP